MADSKNNQQFMVEAIRLSREMMLQGKGGPFGAVIVKDGEIIARGYNQVTSTNDPTAHAEVVAIREASKVLNNFSLAGCTIYTSCEPCPMCLASIYWAGIDRVYYGNTKEDAAAINFGDDFIYSELALPREKRKLPTEQLMRNEAQEAFRLWDEMEDKIAY
ncbi:MAG: nucleoside deaminase [Bacteroidetes bacterium]|nr:nucleoside deaminase [Bacteroidota bacterium]MBU1718224.1 nucleoside deaminase [Bacteroidota bacterium]